MSDENYIVPIYNLLDAVPQNIRARFSNDVVPVQICSRLFGLRSILCIVWDHSSLHVCLYTCRSYTLRYCIYM